MERTKHIQHSLVANADIQTLASAIVSRAQLAARLGIDQYNGERDIYQALGYLKDIEFDHYLDRYLRQDIARAIIDRPVLATWQGKLELVESEKKEDTPFEEAWAALNDKFGLQSIFSRVDRLTGIGRYGIILLGLDDVKNQEQFQNPVRPGTRKLMYLMPFSEGSAKIQTFESDPTNARFGKPLFYSLNIQQAEDGNSIIVLVHYSRVIHVIDNPLESDIESSPRLEVVYNRLCDIEKIVGGDAEMYWRGARPGYNGTVDKDYQFTPSAKKDLKEQIDEYEHNLRRIFVNEGVELKALTQEIANPKDHVDVQVQMISAQTGIPKRVLTGSERGELSSAQDTSEWKTYISIRRQDHAEPRIIKPFVLRCQELGILPKLSTKTFQVQWEDLFTLSESDRVKIGRDRASALKDYTSSPLAEAVMSPEDFLEYGLGLTPEQVNIVKMNLGGPISEEMARIAQTTQDAQPAQTVATPKLKRTK
jgi:hypothetical protein